MYSYLQLNLSIQRIMSATAAFEHTSWSESDSSAAAESSRDCFRDLASSSSPLTATVNSGSMNVSSLKYEVIKQICMHHVIHHNFKALKYPLQ
jgi:hypothetical protein